MAYPKVRGNRREKAQLVTAKTPRLTRKRYEMRMEKIGIRDPQKPMRTTLALIRLMGDEVLRELWAREISKMTKAKAP